MFLIKLIPTAAASELIWQKPSLIVHRASNIDTCKFDRIGNGTVTQLSHLEIEMSRFLYIKFWNKMED